MMAGGCEEFGYALWDLHIERAAMEVKVEVKRGRLTFVGGWWLVYMK